jgi:hypothetical protein
VTQSGAADAALAQADRTNLSGWRGEILHRTPPSTTTARPAADVPAEAPAASQVPAEAQAAATAATAQLLRFERRPSATKHRAVVHARPKAKAAVLRAPAAARVAASTGPRHHPTRPKAARAGRPWTRTSIVFVTPAGSGATASPSVSRLAFREPARIVSSATTGKSPSHAPSGPLPSCPRCGGSLLGMTIGSAQAPSFGGVAAALSPLRMFAAPGAGRLLRDAPTLGLSAETAPYERPG